MAVSWDGGGGGNTVVSHREMVRRMRDDPVLWIENTLKIRTKRGDLVPFRLNIFQRKLVAAVMDRVKEEGDAFFVVLKGRQLGVSSICRALMLWKAMNYVGQQCVFSAHTEPDTKRSMTIMREMLATMNRALGYPLPSMESDSRILWRNMGSAIESRLASGKSQGRSSSINFLHATEVDYYDDVAVGSWKRFKVGIIPSLKVKGAIAIVESTCQGRKALFDLYSQSLNPQSKWRHIFFPWYENPDYVATTPCELTEQEEIDKDTYGLSDQQAWFRASYRLECGELACDREYPNCIDDSFKVAAAGSRVLMSGQSIEDAMGRDFWQLQDREPVIVGVDPSRLRDCTGIAVRQGKNIITVTEIPPMGDAYELANLVARMCEDLKPKVINVDAGNLGGAFIDILQRVTPFRLCGIDFGAAAKNTRKYFNRRAEMYDELRRWIAEGGKLPNNSRLATELMAIELNDRKEGRLMLQPKHKLSKSPDIADACALTMCKDGILGGPRRSSLSFRPMF
jgi:hypothetical protein